MIKKIFPCLLSFAIILSNLLVPMIERITIPKAFGQVKEAKQHE